MISSKIQSLLLDVEPVILQFGFPLTITQINPVKEKLEFISTHGLVEVGTEAREELIVFVSELLHFSCVSFSCLSDDRRIECVKFAASCGDTLFKVHSCYYNMIICYFWDCCDRKRIPELVEVFPYFFVHGEVPYTNVGRALLVMDSINIIRCIQSEKDRTLSENLKTVLLESIIERESIETVNKKINQIFQNRSITSHWI